MNSAQDYLTGLSQLHELTNDEDRRAVWRQGLAALASVSSQQPAPLEGLSPEGLLASTRLALLTGLVDDVGFLSKPVAATALFELAAALPQGIERSDLGRRISTALQTGDGVTFAAVTRALALGVPQALADPVVQARVALALQLPIGAEPDVDALALALISQSELEETWLTGPSTASLAARRLAARLLEAAACEVARKDREGNPVGARAMARPSVRAAWARLLGDREPLVWRHVATARGVLAATVPALAEEIERELSPRNGPAEWRRGATSLAARIGHEPAATLARCRDLMNGELCRRDPGVKMAMVYGLARAAEEEPEAAEELLNLLAQTGEIDVVEAIVELRRLRVPGEFGARAVTASLLRLRALPPTKDDGLLALRQELAEELEPDSPGRPRTLEQQFAAALEDFVAGRDLRPRAEAAFATAVRVLGELETGADATPEARQRSFRCLGQLERGLVDTSVLRELLTVCRPNARPGEGDPLSGLLARLHEWICKREELPLPSSDVPNLTLRLSRLRALLHILDVERGAGDDTAAPARAARLRALRLLLRRVSGDPPSPLRRITCAVLARACDRIVRAQMGELSDILIVVLTKVRNVDDLRVLAEASMVAEIKEVLGAAAELVHLATTPAAEGAERSFLDPLSDLANALPLAVSPRVEGLRQTLVQLRQSLKVLERAGSLSALQPDNHGSVLQGLEGVTLYGARFCAAARTRVGLTGAGGGPTAGRAVHEVEAALEAALRNPEAELREPIRVANAALRADLPAGISDAIARALSRLADLPRDRAAPGAVTELAPAQPSAPLLRMPGWMPPSRILGGFYVQRPIGSGAAGSVFVAQRAHERHEDNAETYALKVPSYNGQNSRTLTEQEFLHLFREEAGALLTLPPHPHLAGFVTFDSVARPKPILVMELVSGATLERIMDKRELTIPSVFGILDGIASGLSAMHDMGIAHLDLKPANVILRVPTSEGDADVLDARAVLVDFGLAGRKLRPGCASPHFGAPEVWDTSMYGATEAPAADVYGFACLAYELFMGRALFEAETLPALIGCHFSHDGDPAGLAPLRDDRRFAPLAQILSAGMVPNPRGRATIVELRDALRELAPELHATAWPLTA